MKVGPGTLVLMSHLIGSLFFVDYNKSSLLHPATQQYDPDAFDSMAVMNSEIWNLGDGEESVISATELLPNVRCENRNRVHHFT